MDPNATKCKGHKASSEDMKVINELRREAMIYRAIPLAAGLGGSTWYAVTKDYLKAHPKYGPIPMVAGAAVAGFTIGFVTYMRSNLAEKFKGREFSPLVGGLTGGFKHREGCPWAKSEAEKGSSSKQSQRSEGQGQPIESKH